MKRYVVLMAALVFLALAGCGQEGLESVESKQTIEHSLEKETGTEEVINIDDEKINIKTEQNNDVQGPAVNGKNDEIGAEIIAKSSNSNSDQNNDANIIIDQIDQELDRVIDTINSLDDVSDEDLNS